MAKIATKHVVIKASKLVRDSAEEAVVLSDEVLASIEAVIQELAGEDIIIEIETLEEYSIEYSQLYNAYKPKHT